MLATSSKTFGAAIDSLFRRVEPDDVGRKLHKRDRSINRAERAIRRELVVHAGVRGRTADIPTLLAYMSISKDIERVGDFAKDLWDLGVAGLDLSAEPDVDTIEAEVGRVADLIVETARIFAERDASTATTLLNENDEFKELLEERMLGEIGTPHGGAGRALFYRYLQRIVAHLMNVMTSVVMPLDRIDYWDEDKADRLD
jgi:phosphate uptake regulator